MLINMCSQKMLFSLLAAAIVALSETILYMIWESRHHKTEKKRPTRKLTKRRKRQNDKIVNETKAVSAAPKRDEDEDRYITPTSSAIRRRIGTTNGHMD